MSRTNKTALFLDNFIDGRPFMILRLILALTLRSVSLYYKCQRYLEHAADDGATSKIILQGKDK